MAKKAFPQAPLTVEELDDVSEVHVIVDDDFTVNCNQSQGKKEDKVPRGNPGCHPYYLPDGKHVLVQELCAHTHSRTSAHFSTYKPEVEVDVWLTSLEVQQEPAVTEVEMSVVSVLLHQFEQLRVQNLTSEPEERKSVFCLLLGLHPGGKNKQRTPQMDIYLYAIVLLIKLLK